MADVAADTGVTAPTVYKHFRNKQDLLAGAILSGLDLVDDMLQRTAGHPLDDLVAATAELVLDRPDLWTLLQREGKFLDPDRHVQVERQFGVIVAQFVDRLRRERPELDAADARLLVTAATAALASPSVRRTASSRAVVTRELTRCALTILRLRLPQDSAATSATAGPSSAAAPPPPPPDGAYPRRAELLDSAIDLFYRRGYAAVSLDDIGSAVGITGPSIYHHYAMKTDILVAAFRRAADQLVEDYARQAAGRSPRSLIDLVGVYIDFCLRNRSLVGVYVSEAISLPVDEQQRISAVLRDLVAEWADALMAQDDRVDRQAARIRAGAALTVIDDVIRLGPFHVRPLIAQETRAIAIAALLGDPPPQP
jgi:AcrR family transcriptional regulator